MTKQFMPLSKSRELLQKVIAEIGDAANADIMGKRRYNDEDKVLT